MRPGDWVAVGLVAEALAIDVVLLRYGEDPISTCVRRSLVARAVALGIALHLIATLPHDPLRWAGDRLARSR